MEAAGFISAARPVEGTSWSAHAGSDPAVALASARSVLVRGVVLGAIVLLVLLAALALVNRRIAEPLRRLDKLVRDSGPHTHAALGQVAGPSEIVRLGNDFRAAIEARERYEAQLAQQEFHDPVTGLANRALLTERLNHSLERADRSHTIVGVLFIDLDRFKLINESFGHIVGDDVLAGVADRLKALLRAGDTLARFGGDEFVVIRDDCEDHDLDGLADRVLACLNEPLEAADTIVRVTASIGIASSTPTHRGGDLLRDAHAAMYLAKEHGRATRERFDPTMHSRASARLAMETELQSALERNQLSVVYQPKVDLQ
jgi:diguanylate cyclase (GGDEF)-like protein